MVQNIVQLELGTPEETCRFAIVLGTQLMPGDTILLAGSVGSGKTHFSRCLILSQMEIAEDVPSPTFTLVQTYETSIGEIWHADLYRLSNFSEIEELGLNQAFSDAICLVEWPDRLGGHSPKDALTVSLDAPFGDDRRLATLIWENPTWECKLKKVLND